MEFNSSHWEVEREYDWSITTPNVAVLESLAVYEHGDSERVGDVLELPLTEYTDPDGLDRFVRNTPSPILEFRLQEYRVRIQDNTVSITTMGSNGIPAT
jgi:hypothetical protein